MGVLSSGWAVPVGFFREIVFSPVVFSLVAVVVLVEQSRLVLTGLRSPEL